MLEYCKLDPKEQSEILIEIQTLSFKKRRLKVSSAKWRPFCLGLNVLTAKCNYMCRDKCKPIHQGTVMTRGIRPTTCLYESVELSCFHNKSKYHNVSISHFITTCVPKNKYIRWVYKGHMFSIIKIFVWSRSGFWAIVSLSFVRQIYCEHALRVRVTGAFGLWWLFHLEVALV